MIEAVVKSKEKKESQGRFASMMLSCSLHKSKVDRRHGGGVSESCGDSLISSRGALLGGS